MHEFVIKSNHFYALHDYINTQKHCPYCYKRYEDGIKLEHIPEHIAFCFAKFIENGNN